MRYQRLCADRSSRLARLALLAMVMSGCAQGKAGATSRNDSISGGSAPGLTAYSASIAVPTDTPGKQVTASCRAGEQLVGGGFLATDTFEYDVAVLASYPSSASAWTAVAGSSASFILEVSVYCLPKRPALGVHTAQTPTASGGVALCPTGEVELSDGFDGSATGETYAVCASQGFRADASVTMTFNPHSSQNSYYPARVTVTCPEGQVALGGEETDPDIVMESDSAGPPFRGWSFTLGGDSDAQLSARCVTLSV
jgi:hypothetical protein